MILFILYKNEDVADLEELKRIGVEELCPRATIVTPEKVAMWHREGFNVRAYGPENEEMMRYIYDCLTDGMTVNFPDKLTAYMRK